MIDMPEPWKSSELVAGALERGERKAGGAGVEVDGAHARARSGLPHRLVVSLAALFARRGRPRVAAKEKCAERRATLAAEPSSRDE